jgi:hypothetical protein
VKEELLSVSKIIKELNHLSLIIRSLNDQFVFLSYNKPSEIVSLMKKSLGITRNKILLLSEYRRESKSRNSSKIGVGRYLDFE